MDSDDSSGDEDGGGMEVEWPAGAAARGMAAAPESASASPADDEPAPLTPAAPANPDAGATVLEVPGAAAPVFVSLYGDAAASTRQPASTATAGHPSACVAASLAGPGSSLEAMACSPKGGAALVAAACSSSSRARDSLLVGARVLLDPQLSPEDAAR